MQIYWEFNYMIDHEIDYEEGKGEIYGFVLYV